LTVRVCITELNHGETSRKIEEERKRDKRQNEFERLRRKRER